MIVVEETNLYKKTAKKLLTISQQKEIVEILRKNPTIGVLLKGSGGCRKFRYANQTGKGKSNGVRIIHFYVNNDEIVYLIQVFAKNEKDNITQKELKELKVFTTLYKI